MNPHQKAKSIIDSFNNYVNGADNSGRYWQDLAFDNAKECSLILVNEILNECYDMGLSGRYKYWQDVKLELESFKF